MSTLVKLLLALVLQFTNAEAPQGDQTAATKSVESTYTLQDLNPEYIITRDEYLSYIKDAAI